MSKMGEEFNRRLEKYAPELVAVCKRALEVSGRYGQGAMQWYADMEKIIAKIERMEK